MRQSALFPTFLDYRRYFYDVVFRHILFIIITIYTYKYHSHVYVYTPLSICIKRLAWINEREYNGEIKKNHLKRSYRVFLIGIYILPRLALVFIATEIPDIIGLASITIGYIIATIATRKAIVRGEEFYELLIDLENRALDDYEYDLQVQNLHTINNPGLHLTIQRKNFKRPLKAIVNTPEENSSEVMFYEKDLLEKSSETVSHESRRNKIVEQGDYCEDSDAGNEREDKGIHKMKNIQKFYAGLGVPLYVYIFLSIISILPYMRSAILSLSEGKIIKFILEVLVVISLFLFTLGEAFYAVLLVLRWTGLTQHCARSWGYELSDIIFRYGDKASIEMKIGSSQHKRWLCEFEEKLDVLHDIYAVPLTVLNQKISSVMSNGLVSFLFIMIAHAAFAFVSTNRTPQVNAIVSVCCVIIMGILLYYSGNISQTFVLQKHSLRRPSIITSLAKIYGNYDAVQMFMSEYIMYNGVGFSFLSVIFTHQAAMGVMLTCFLGLGFLFGPIVAKKLMGAEDEQE